MNSAFPVLVFLSSFSCLGLDQRSKYFIASTWSREERASTEPFCRMWLLCYSLIFSFRKPQLSPCSGQALLSIVLVLQKSLMWWWKVSPMPATGLCVPHTYRIYLQSLVPSWCHWWLKRKCCELDCLDLSWKVMWGHSKEEEHRKDQEWGVTAVNDW